VTDTRGAPLPEISSTESLASRPTPEALFTEGQLSERVRDLAAGLRVGLHVLLHRERHVGVPEPHAQRLPVDLRIAARRGVTVANVVQVDEREAHALCQRLEPAGDHAGVRRPPVLPAEQRPVILMVRPVFLAFGVKAAALRAPVTAALAPGVRP
jgi:hypothetical protein